MYKTQKGFTLIELVVVIVLLGILGVTALGKYQDLSADAQTAANEGVASELSSASAINYAASILGTPDLVIGTNNFDCANVGPLFASGSIHPDYSITGTFDCTAGGVGAAFNCAVVSTNTPPGNSFNATVLCTST